MEPTSGTKMHYADAVERKKPGKGRQEKTMTLVAQIEEKKAEKESDKEVQTEGPTATPNSEEEEQYEMEELAGFKAVTYRRYRGTQQQQVLIGTARDSELKVENKKAWLYLRRMARETTVEGVKRFLNRKGIKDEETIEELTTVGPCKAFKVGFPFEQLQLTENPGFWQQGAIVQPFHFSHRTQRQHRGAMDVMDM
jgi:hypothetical protein